MHLVVGAVTGALVGLILALVGGGGSILAVPLLLYGGAVSDLHWAIGTSALAVGVNAGTNLIGYARRNAVRWLDASVFASAGVLGAALGAHVGKGFDARKLSGYFAALIFMVGILMFRYRAVLGSRELAGGRRNIGRLVSTGGATGIVSGFFGIGGGFLVVPGLMYAAGLPMLHAIGSSLVAVTAFGLTTAVSYMLAGWVDWPLAAALVAGGLFGGAAGIRLAKHLSARKGVLQSCFAVAAFAAASYMAWRSLH